jgi:hypothetical protein
MNHAERRFQLHSLSMSPSALSRVILFCVGCWIFVMLGWLIANTRLTETQFLITLIILLCATPLVVLSLRRQLDVFHPITVFGIAMLIMFALRPISVISNDMTIHLGYDISTSIVDALTIAVIGIICALLGYTAPLGRWLARSTRGGPDTWNSLAVKQFAIALIVLGATLYGLFLLQSGGIETLVWILRGRDSSQDALFLGSNGYHSSSFLHPCS